MSQRLCSIALLALAGWGAVASPPASAQPDAALVVVAKLDDAIHPITAEFVRAALETAEERRASLFVLQLSTPGGLEASMREIMQAQLNSTVPTCVWVGPSGVRAGSAGFMVALAADFVLMAPGTNMGAAHPVPAGGGELDETMAEKITQDAVAYARSVAERQGRPPDLAAAAVSESRSFPAGEAVEVGLADALADDIDGVLEVLDGRTSGRFETPLDLQGATIETVEMTLRQRVLSVLANPQLAYILLLLGLAGLYFEISTPGAVLPGVLGALCLVLALLAMQVLPISFAGLALIGLAVLFFILEVKVISYGLLTVAGLVALVLGSMMLFTGPIPELRLQLGFVVPVVVAIAGVAGILMWLVVGTHRGRVHTGGEGLVGEAGRAVTALGPDGHGRVFVHGELWRARSDVPVRRGDAVEIVEIESNLVVRVRPASPGEGVEP